MPPRYAAALLVLAILCSPALNPPARAQASAGKDTATAAQQAFQAEQARIHSATTADYDDMLHQLGIRPDQMRPGADGNGQGPHPVLYDEAKVPLLHLPDPLKLTSGQAVRTPSEWWSLRRPELVRLLEDNMYGRIPAHVPGVSWTVTGTQTSTISGKEAVTQTLRGHVDNSADTSVNVDIDVELTLPAHPQGKVPVVIAFDWPASFWTEMARRTGRTMPAPKGPTAREEVLARGYGYALLVPTSVQADNGAGLTAGIIGLTNRGARRTPDQWGALRAWGWGASRLLDYFETRSEIDIHRIGISGHSRYGKAALVTMAFDPRFAIGYISSSGEGGAKPSRRHWGELTENVTAPSEYHWMAGNFLRYGSLKTTNDLPVDSHDLIALCAPRAVFLSAGTQQAGDGWADARGSFLAAFAAGPVYKLLGTPDLGTTTQPPVLSEVGNGPLAFRQHDQGHTPAPNWPFFLDFMQREMNGRDFALNLKAQ